MNAKQLEKYLETNPVAYCEIGKYKTFSRSTINAMEERGYRIEWLCDDVCDVHAKTKIIPLPANVEKLKGEFVKRKADSKKVYQVGDYCRSEKKWHLIDCSDVWGNGLYVKSGTVLFIGFDY